VCLPISSNNGISAFIDSNGIIVNKKESTEKGVIEVNNYKDIKKTLFSKYGNKIFFYFIIFYISLFFLIYKKES
jgi:apolipoprotein N-acyltransferase